MAISINEANAGVWIVIPAYNEAERLGTTLASVAEFSPRIVVIDDGSTDGTPAEALRHPVWLVRHALNRGQGAAIQTGIDFAIERGADIIVTFDADGQHSARDVAALVEPIRKGVADVSLGSRFLGTAVGLPKGRRLILKLGVIFTRIFSRIQVTDTHNGLRAFSRSAAECISITHDRMAHASEILDQIQAHGLRYQEVPVTIHYTPGTLAKGQSSWNALKMAGQLILGRLLR
jgi:glycosyltransferase involved in cell wall biosynthesis